MKKAAIIIVVALATAGAALAAYTAYYKRYSL